MRTLKFITGHVTYNPAYMFLQVPTENHQYNRMINIRTELKLKTNA